MLCELQVSDLGVIDRLSLVFGPGMTALTGETGAGKTLVVEAIELLMGGRADPILVRPGSAEAVVEGRFLDGDDEMVLRRVVPASGRSRAYINGSMATVGALADVGARLVDLHGQHEHQSLLSRRVQRAALDRFADIDLSPLVEARVALAAIDARRAVLGGDPHERARELELVRFQVDELDAAALRDADEDEQLDTEQDVLGDASAHQQAAEQAAVLLSPDGGAGEQVALVLANLDGRAPFTEIADRLRNIAGELRDLGAEIRGVGELIHDDPGRLDAIRERRKLLHDLRRKYGDTLAEVMAFHLEARVRLGELVAHDVTAARLDADADAARVVVRRAELAVGAARRAAAPELQTEVESRLAALALDGARLEVRVGDDDPGDEVTFLLSTNPGSPVAPLAKVASGGELARAMLALRLVLSDAPPTLIFDEVDAGVGGAAAIAVGAALAELGADHQVLVVTHLAQVAAGADQHLGVRKQTTPTATSTTVIELDDAGREAELARMLSGRDTARARDHARELRASSARR